MMSYLTDNTKNQLRQTTKNTKIQKSSNTIDKM